jgi:RimJ/RimL family protein N-acetyltransferase
MLSLRADVTLEPLSLDHAPRMAAWMQDPTVREGVGLRSEPSLQSTRDWIARALADLTIQAFAVLLAGQHVGNVVLDRWDPYLQTARLSIYLGEPEARGRGVGMTAVFRAARAGFAHWQLHKIWLIVHEENSAALAAYERIGFRREGLLRDEFFLGGRRLGAVYMGLLRGEFALLGAQADVAGGSP